MTKCETAEFSRSRMAPSRSNSVSSFLSVAEDIAGQRQNVRRELKKMEEESRAVEFHL